MIIRSLLNTLLRSRFSNAWLLIKQQPTASATGGCNKERSDGSMWNVIDLLGRALVDLIKSYESHLTHQHHRLVSCRIALGSRIWRRVNVCKRSMVEIWTSRVVHCFISALDVRGKVYRSWKRSHFVAWDERFKLFDVDLHNKAANFDNTLGI